jgi:hypothetical protein
MTITRGFISRAYLEDIASAIREKLGVSYLMTPLEFPTEISKISDMTVETNFLPDTIQKTVNDNQLKSTLDVRAVKPYCFENCTNLTSKYNLPLCKSIGTRSFANTKISEIVLSDNIKTIASDAFSGVSYVHFIIDRPENFVYGYPWGATYATIDWTDHIDKTIDGLIVERTVSDTSRIFQWKTGGNGAYKVLDSIKLFQTPEECETLMSKGYNSGELYQTENQIGAYRALISDSPMDVDTVRIYLGRYSGNNQDFIITVEYKTANDEWIEIQDVSLTKTCSYPINYFDVSLPENSDIYGIRWIHKKEPLRTSGNNICFFGFVLYKDGSVVPQLEDSELIETLAEVTNVRTYCFENCTKITGELSLPLAETIGTCAFKGCSNITAISFGENLTSIGANAFQSSGIKTITIQKASGSVSGSPWGASGATVVWNG